MNKSSEANEIDTSLNDGHLSLVINGKKYDDITYGRCSTKQIYRGENSIRNTCCMTVGIHLYANSLWLLWDSVKYYTFKKRKGLMMLDKSSVSCKH